MESGQEDQHVQEFLRYQKNQKRSVTDSKPKLMKNTEYKSLDITIWIKFIFPQRRIDYFESLLSDLKISVDDIPHVHCVDRLKQLSHYVSRLRLREASLGGQLIEQVAALR